MRNQFEYIMNQETALNVDNIMNNNNHRKIRTNRSVLSGDDDDNLIITERNNNNNQLQIIQERLAKRRNEITMSYKEMKNYKPSAFDFYILRACSFDSFCFLYDNCHRH